MAVADSKAKQFVASTLDKYGWVNASIAGADTAHEFWLLVQHQSLDLQEKALPRLKKAVDSGTASEADYAYLYDRVQILTGKPQLWGTQTQCGESGPVLMAVEKPEELDARRAKIGLEAEADYLGSEMLKQSCKHRP